MPSSILRQAFLKLLSQPWVKKSSGKFIVSDQGSGFPSLQAEKIFELSNRAHGSEYLGNGVGLPICRMLVHNHGGKIWAESSPGQGARFHFTLPAAIEHNRSVAV